MVGSISTGPGPSDDTYGKTKAERVAIEHVQREYSEFLSNFTSHADSLLPNFDKDNQLSQLWAASSHSAVEAIDATQLVQTDDHAALKIILTLTSLIEEMDCLTNSAEVHLYPLLYYGEGYEEKEFVEGECHKCVGRMIPFFQGLLSYTNRCFDVVRNTVQQLSVLYCGGDRKSRFFDVADTHLKIVFEKIATLLLVLIKLDSSVNRNTLLRDHVAQFQHVVSSIQQEPQSFGISDDELKLLEELLYTVSEKLLSGTVFLRCVTQNFEEGPAVVNKNPSFLKEMNLNLTGLFQDLIQRFENEAQRDNLELLHQYAGLLALHVFHAHLGLKTDKKLFKLIWDSLKYVVAVPLLGSTLWFPDQFLSTYLPEATKLIDSKMLDAALTSRANVLKLKTQQLSKYVSQCNFQITLWLSRLKGEISTLDELGLQATILLQGIAFANQLSGSVQLLISLHSAIQPVISKATVLGIFRLIELMKCLQVAFEKQTSTVASCFVFYEDRIKHNLLALIGRGQQNLSNDKRQNRAIMSAFTLAEKSLAGPCSSTRVAVTRLSLALACGLARTRVFSEEDFPVVVASLQKLEQLSRSPRTRLARIVNTETLYWHKSLIETYLKDAYDKRVDLLRLNWALRAIYDCEDALKHVQHGSPQVASEKWHVFVRQSLERNLLQPLCRDVENELRIQTHSHLPQAENNPLKSNVPFVLGFLEKMPLKLGHQCLYVWSYVEQYLGKTFYNLAAVASHDWRKYGEMRLYAQHIFSLSPIEDRLPSQTLEQGLDVLEIMRNIHVFVSRFSYNLNNQFFVELSSESKHLNCIGIRQVSNSIRTHGPGIVNTAINFTYQFLRKKFYVFSQFLFDEHIKSRLMKDARFLREIKEKEENQQQQNYRVPETQTGVYPYDRAEKFNRGIRKLGLNAEGLSYLDQFRMLITQLGNSLGYVRMLRSGAIHCSAEACAFVPDLAELVDLSGSALNLADNKSSVGSHRGLNQDASFDLAEGLFENLASNTSGLSTVSVTSAKNLDKVLDGLAKSLSEGSDYFKLLVAVFRPFFRDPRQIHLRNFYLLVPPLMVNYIEHIITCKEKLNKKNKQGAAFTDDGFVMGVAYALAVLEQWKEFDSLHWFASVKSHFASQRSVVMTTVSAGQDGEKLKQTMSLTMHRLDTYHQEYDLLFYNLNSARIFFRDDKVEPKSGSASLADESNQSSA